MNKAKIRLSPNEMELVTNAEIILTKNRIIEKTKLLLESVQEEMISYIKTRTHPLPGEIIEIPPKISKGENYNGLPYLILDYPRYFEKENACAIRTMFWWGHFFSITLHLSGKYKKMFQQKIISSYASFAKENYFICTNKDEWEHHFEETNYSLITKIDEPGFKESIQKNTFIKMAYKIRLSEWETAPEIILQNFEKIIEAIF